MISSGDDLKPPGHMWPYLETLLVVKTGIGKGVIATWWQKPEMSLNIATTHKTSSQDKKLLFCLVTKLYPILL